MAVKPDIDNLRPENKLINRTRLLKKEEFTCSSVGFTEIIGRNLTLLTHFPFAPRILACVAFGACGCNVYPEIALGAQF